MVGSTPAAMAAVIVAENLGLDTLVLDAGAADGQIRDYLGTCTEDLGPATAPAAQQLPLGSLDTSESPGGPFDFFGATLRDWAQRCYQSQGALVSSAPLDPRLGEDYRSAGQSVRVVPVGAVLSADLDQSPADWLAARLPDPNPFDSPNSVQHLVFDGIDVSGVQLEVHAIGTRFGVLLPVGSAGAHWPQIPAEFPAVELAFVSRNSSRFTRLELLSGLKTAAE